MNLCSDHSWAGQGECPKCETAFAGLTPAAPQIDLLKLVGWQYRDALDDGVWGSWVGCDKRLSSDEHRQVRAVYATADATQAAHELQRRLAAGEKQDAELLTLLQGAVTLIDRNFHDDRAAQLWLSAARSAFLRSVGVAT